MPSTFTTNLGIQKPANGEQSGTWGETVNTNSDILDRAISGSLSLSLSGTSSTLTTLQGVASDGQYKVLVLTGSPSGTHTITISAATVQTLYFVINSTAQSVIFTQGSGGNVTIVAGASAIIYSDGAGATAKVTNVTDALAMSAVKITGGTITGVTITGITDLAVADGGTGVSTLTGYVKGAGTAALTASATIPSTDITGLGTMATQAASAVAITGGTITGITPIVVSAGGTGVATLTGYVKGAGTSALTATATIPSTDITGLTATVTELNYTAGVTSAIQTQLDAKAPLASPALTGTPTAPTAAAGTNTTQVATTAFALANSTGQTLLGTLTTTSGSTQTLSGLVLTSYKQLLFMYNSVRGNSATVSHVHRVGSAEISARLGSNTYVKAKVLVSLVDGYAYPVLATGSSATGAFVWFDTGGPIPYGYQVEQTGYTTATTSVSVSVSSGNFNAGSVVIYGVK